MGIFDWLKKRLENKRVETAPIESQNPTAAQSHPVCANCGRHHGDGPGFGGMVDQCSSCGKPICRSCKKLVSYHQFCPLCGGSNWS